MSRRQKGGEVSILKNTTLFLGDCLEFMEGLEDNSVDCIVTSPPYNKGFFSKQKPSNQIWNGFEINYNTYEDNLPIKEYEQWMIKCLQEMHRLIKPNGSIFFNHKPTRYNNQIYHPLSFILNSGIPVYQEIIWDRRASPNIRNDILVPCTERIYWLRKEKPVVYRENIGKNYISEVWQIPAKKQRDHPAPFQYEVVENCILLSTKENDLVFDPFMGIGTAGIVAKNLNRSFVGAEIDERYYNIAVCSF